MSLLYFILGFTFGALLILVLFTLWWDDDEEMERKAEAIRKAEGWASK